MNNTSLGLVPDIDISLEPVCRFIWTATTLILPGDQGPRLRRFPPPLIDLLSRSTATVELISLHFIHSQPARYLLGLNWPSSRIPPVTGRGVVASLVALDVVLLSWIKFLGVGPTRMEDRTLSPHPTPPSGSSRRGSLVFPHPTGPWVSTEEQCTRSLLLKCY